MAHQVNYAAQLLPQRGVPASTWLFLVNIDSQFSRDGLMAVVEHIDNEARIIQQSAVFLSNYSRLEPWAGLRRLAVALDPSARAEAPYSS
jgi:hypothetical protein